MKKTEIFVPAQSYYLGYNREQALESIGPGWAGLINEIFDKVESYPSRIYITQVKEKWGGLRIYHDPYMEDFEKFLAEMEKKSFTICEDCGKEGKLRAGGWYRTLCDEHAHGRKPIKPF